jgi:two-component system NtrC family sensor kinase
MEEIAAKIQILIVEDEDFVQELFRLELSKRNYNIIACRNVHETMKILYNKNIHVDFCLLDHDLPDGNGLNLLSQIKTTRSEMPIIIMTGQGSPSIFKAAMHGGAFDYIEKPFSIEKDVLPVIQRLVSNLLLKKENTYLTHQILHNSKLATLGELSATVVHDIRGPLAMIQVTCEDLEEEFGENKSIDEASLHLHIAQITKACGRIKKLVDHLRNYSRNDKEEIEETKKIKHIIEDSLFMVEQKIRKLGIKVTTEIDPLIQDSELMCFPNKLEQVLMNLMSNACDAMQHKESHKELNISAKTENGFLYISVIDTGSGIPENVMPRIFESFFTTKPKNEGTGLGLSIVKSIVREHDGDLIVQSEINKGTTFQIKLSTSRVIAPHDDQYAESEI